MYEMNSLIVLELTNNNFIYPQKEIIHYNDAKKTLDALMALHNYQRKKQMQKENNVSNKLQDQQYLNQQTNELKKKEDKIIEDHCDCKSTTQLILDYINKLNEATNKINQLEKLNKFLVEKILENDQLYEKKYNGLLFKLEESEQNRLCSLCFDNPKNVLLLPCKHFSICYGCYTHNSYTNDQTQNQMKQCPICRKDITAAIHTFVI